VKKGLILGGLIAGLLATIALSSIATQYVADRLSHHPALGKPVIGDRYEPFGWILWQNEPWAASVRPAFLWPDLGAAGVGLTCFGVMFVGMLWQGRGRRRPQPFPDVHGSADWASPEDIRTTGLLDNTTGVYVGAWEDPNTKMVHYLRDTTGAHIAGIAPTRSGKGLGWVLPNLLSWTESLFVYDPKGELWQLTAGWRKSIGHNVLHWYPGSPDASCGFNFLEEVRLGTEYEVADVQNIAVMLIDHDGTGFRSHWDRAAFGFLSGYLLHILYVMQDKGEHAASLPLAATMLSSPTIDPVALYTLMADSKHGAVINAAGIDQLKRDERERNAVLSTVKTYLSLFFDPIVARNCTRGSFRLCDLMDHDKPTTLYVELPGTDSVRLRPLVRLLITMMLNKLIGAPVAFDRMQQPTARHQWRMLMQMDEFPDLGRLTVFEGTMAIMAGAGLIAFLIMQDREQLLKAYGQNQTLLSNVHIIGAYAPNETKTADWLSHELGKKTINLEQFSESGKRNGLRLGHLSRSFSPIGRALLTSDEVRRLPGAVKDGSRIVQAGQMLLLVTGHRPVLGRQILHFEDPVFAARSAILPPEASDDLELLRRFKAVEPA